MPIKLSDNNAISEANGDLATPKHANREVLELFKLFFDGRTAPYSRAYEFAIGNELYMLIYGRHMSFEGVASVTRVPLREVEHIVGGLFKREEADVRDIEKIASHVGTTFKVLYKVGREAQEEHAKHRYYSMRDDYGWPFLIQELHRDRIQNPLRYENSLRFGAQLRVLRESSSLKRTQLEKDSGVSVSYIQLLEHFLVPYEMMEIEKLRKLAESLGVTVGYVLNEGDKVMQIIGNASGEKAITNRLRDLAHLRRINGNPYHGYRIRIKGRKRKERMHNAELYD